MKLQRQYTVREITLLQKACKDKLAEFFEYAKKHNEITHELFYYTELYRRLTWELNHHYMNGWEILEDNDKVRKERAEYTDGGEESDHYQAVYDAEMYDEMEDRARYRKEEEEADEARRKKEWQRKGEEYLLNMLRADGHKYNIQRKWIQNDPEMIDSLVQQIADHIFELRKQVWIGREEKAEFLKEWHAGKDVIVFKVEDIGRILWLSREEMQRLCAEGYGSLMRSFLARVAEKVVTAKRGIIAYELNVDEIDEGRGDITFYNDYEWIPGNVWPEHDVHPKDFRMHEQDWKNMRSADPADEQLSIDKIYAWGRWYIDNVVREEAYKDWNENYEHPGVYFIQGDLQETIWDDDVPDFGDFENNPRFYSDFCDYLNKHLPNATVFCYPNTEEPRGVEIDFQRKDAGYLYELGYNYRPDPESTSLEEIAKEEEANKEWVKTVEKWDQEEAEKKAKEAARID